MSNSRFGSNQREMIISRVYKKRTFHDLSDSALKDVFIQLTLKQMFGIQRVSQRWKALTEELLAKKTGFTFSTETKPKAGMTSLSHFLNGSEDFHCSEKYNRHETKDEIKCLPTDIRLQSIGFKCNQIKSLVLKTAINQNNFESIHTMFPSIECIKIEDNSSFISDGLRLGSHFANVLKHVSINCEVISVSHLSQFLSGLLVLEELELIRFQFQNRRNTENQTIDRLEDVFSVLREGVKRIAIIDSYDRNPFPVQVLNMKCGQSLESLKFHSSFTLRIDIQSRPEFQPSLPNLKELYFGRFADRENTNIPFEWLRNFGHLQKLGLYFTDLFRTNDWAESIPMMSTVRELELIDARLTGPVMPSLIRAFPLVEKLSINFGENTFRCSCFQFNRFACQTCILPAVYQLSELKHLKKIKLNDSKESIPVSGIALRPILTALRFDFTAFPALQWFAINWRRFPRIFKRPLFDGMSSLAERNPQKLFVLQTLTDENESYISQMRIGWFTAIGKKRLKSIPPNLKLTFFKDLSLE